jgi:ribonuclease T1
MRWLSALILAAFLTLAQARGPAPLTVDQLPTEARQTLSLIAQGGPFPHVRDGIRFGNYEGRLPHRAGNYYREYTVPTPGLPTRGPRRIVTGKGGERYYSPDHYRTFQVIVQ